MPVRLPPGHVTSLRGLWVTEEFLRVPPSRGSQRFKIRGCRDLGATAAGRGAQVTPGQPGRGGAVSVQETSKASGLEVRTGTGTNTGNGCFPGK